jgi:uncharacterized protein YlxW (UPF0749 family)
MPGTDGAAAASTGGGETDVREEGRQEALERDYQILLGEKARLDKEREQLQRKSRASRDASVATLNKKIQALNAKIEDFQRRAADASRGAAPGTD